MARSAGCSVKNREHTTAGWAALKILRSISKTAPKTRNFDNDEEGIHLYNSVVPDIFLCKI
jgi:hypothetical protein